MTVDCIERKSRRELARFATARQIRELLDKVLAEYPNDRELEFEILELVEEEDFETMP